MVTAALSGHQAAEDSTADLSDSFQDLAALRVAGKEEI
jgi:hypothetical protein